jgi:hypothetical protein
MSPQHPGGCKTVVKNSRYSPYFDPGRSCSSVAISSEVLQRSVGLCPCPKDTPFSKFPLCACANKHKQKGTLDRVPNKPDSRIRHAQCFGRELLGCNGPFCIFTDLYRPFSDICVPNCSFRIDVNKLDSCQLPVQLFGDAHHPMRITDHDPLAARFHQTLPFPI